MFLELYNMLSVNLQLSAVWLQVSSLFFLHTDMQTQCEHNIGSGTAS